jgi:hypothetical protein
MIKPANPQFIWQILKICPKNTSKKLQQTPQFSHKKTTKPMLWHLPQIQPTPLGVPHEEFLNPAKYLALKVNNS